MNIKEITSFLNSKFPFSTQESYDNSGIILQFDEEIINNVLITLDITQEVIDEAIEKQINLIISHHPIIFSGIKKLSTLKAQDRVIIGAIQHKISIIAMHTNIDNSIDGVNGRIAQILNLQNIEILRPHKNSLYKIITYAPHDYSGIIREALFASGAGQIGNYSNCSFNSLGEGTFKALENSTPFIGQKNSIHFEPETKIEVIIPEHLLVSAIQNLKSVHPYEEVAYDIIPIQNTNTQVGSGIIGNLEKEMDPIEFFALLKTKLPISIIKHSPICTDTISKIAYCGGSGSFLIEDAKKQKADIYITGDLKYHDFFETENTIILADIGHFESEQHTIDIIYDVLIKKFPNFAILKSGINTNPIQYYL